MDFTGISALITALSGPIGAAGGWLYARWQEGQKARKAEQVALKTAESWNHTSETWQGELNSLKHQLRRAQQIIDDQDDRIVRKDARIAHLEALLDRRLGVNP